MKEQSVMEKAKQAIRRHRMLCPGDTVLVALSGGADSMTLLCVLMALKDVLGLKEIRALHMNHGLRGAEADRDEAFVQAECQKRGIPLEICHAQVAQRAAQSKEGIEEAGRKLRYDFFARARGGDSCIKVATAHTQSDNMETVLLHIVRGCGTGGLTGIPPIRDYIIRPLLDCTRSEIEAFCQSEQIPYVTDSTNADPTYSRNLIRHQVIPALYLLNPKANEAFARLTDAAGMDTACLDELAEKALCEATNGDTLSAAALVRQPRAIRLRALKLRAKAAGAGELSSVHLGAMDALLVGAGCASLPGGVKAVCLRHRLSFLPPYEKPTETALSFPIQPGASCLLNDRLYTVSVISREEYEKKKKIHKNLFKFAADYDMIGDGLFFRYRLDGDFLHPAGRDCGKSLKKLLNEEGVLSVLRDTVPLLCDERGIVCVVGFCCDERVRIKGETRSVLLIEMSEGVKKYGTE